VLQFYVCFVLLIVYFRHLVNDSYYSWKFLASKCDPTST